MATENNNKQDKDGESGRDPGQAGQDVGPQDSICPVELRRIMDKIHKQYGRALRRLAGRDGI